MESNLDLQSMAKRLKPEGAKCLELYFEKSEETSFSCLNGKISTNERSIVSGFGVRVLDSKGRQGFSYCDSGAQLESTIGRALSLCRFSANCEGFMLPEPQKYKSVPAQVRKGISEIASLDVSGARRLFELFISASQQGGCKALEGAFSYETSDFEIANSNGLGAKDSSGSVFAVIQSKFEEYTSSAIVAKQRLGGIESELEEEGAKCALLARQGKGAKKMESGKYDVIFELPVLHSLIFDILLPSFDGDNVRRKVSKLASRQGMKVFSEKLTIAEDPFSPLGFYSGFDGEGVASAARPLVESGTVSRFFYDYRTACLSGIDPLKAAGSCERASFQSMPHIGESNLVVPAGECASLEEAAESSFVQLHSFHGTHTANTTTGDFSVIADQAFLCSKGANGKGAAGKTGASPSGAYIGSKKPVRGVIIAGNAFELLSKIKAVESQSGKFLNLISPRILFEGVQIVG